MMDDQWMGAPRFRKQLTDIRDAGDGILIRVEVPGVDRGDIELNLTETTLEISAKKKTGKDMEGDGAYMSERRFSSFRQAVSLPVEVIPEKAEARFYQGVLYIEVPKVRPEGRGKRLEIE